MFLTFQQEVDGSAAAADGTEEEEHLQQPDDAHRGQWRGHVSLHAVSVKVFVDCGI